MGNLIHNTAWQWQYCVNHKSRNVPLMHYVRFSNGYHRRILMHSVQFRTIPVKPQNQLFLYRSVHWHSDTLKSRFFLLFSAPTVPPFLHRHRTVPKSWHLSSSSFTAKLFQVIQLKIKLFDIKQQVIHPKTGSFSYSCRLCCLKMGICKSW